jgi:hypothetical protein
MPSLAVSTMRRFFSLSARPVGTPAGQASYISLRHPEDRGRTGDSLARVHGQIVVQPPAGHERPDVPTLPVSTPSERHTRSHQARRGQPNHAQFEIDTAMSKERPRHGPGQCLHGPFASVLSADLAPLRPFEGHTVVWVVSTAERAGPRTSPGPWHRGRAIRTLRQQMVFESERAFHLAIRI